METTIQSEKTSLKTVSQSLSETYVLLNEIDEKLDFAVNGNTPKDKSEKAVEYPTGTLDHISTKMFDIARKVSDISKLTNKITGA